MIHCPPFPVDGLNHCGSLFVARGLLAEAELASPGFCKQHDLPLDPVTFEILPGTALEKVRRQIAKVWPKIPASAKRAFLVAQLANARDYVAMCIQAFELAGIEPPADLGA
jgi:hypothetical protein